METIQTYTRRPRSLAVSCHHFESNGLAEMLAELNNKFLDPDKDFPDESYQNLSNLIRFSFHVATFCNFPYSSLKLLVECCIYYYVNQPVHKKSNLKIFLLWLKNRFHYSYELPFPFFDYIDSEQIDDIVNSFNRFL